MLAKWSSVRFQGMLIVVVKEDRTCVVMSGCLLCKNIVANLGTYKVDYQHTVTLLKGQKFFLRLSRKRSSRTCPRLT